MLICVVILVFVECTLWKLLGGSNEDLVSSCKLPVLVLVQYFSVALICFGFVFNQWRIL